MNTPLHELHEPFLASPPMARHQTTAPRDLEAIRGEIDAIDEAIYDLVERRAALADEVRLVKPDRGAAALRPAREGRMLRRLAARPRGKMSLEQVWRLWRELIMANSRLQFPLTVDTVAATGDLSLWDMGRAHFCFETGMSAHGDAGQALAALESGAHRVALLPFAEATWWERLTPGGRHRVFGVLPMIRPGEADEIPEAALVGEVSLADSGGDVSVVRARGGELAARLPQALATAGLEPAYQHLWPGRDMAVIGVAGFLPEAAEAPAPLPQLCAPGLDALVVGAHPRAVSPKEPQE